MIFSIQYIQYPFLHLRDISRSSKYIRYVIIDWLMTRKLDVNLLTVNLLTGGGSLTYYKPVVNRKRAGKSHNFDISMVQDYVIKVNGLRVQGNNLRLRLTMKNGREVSKGFSCNSLGKDDLEALAEIQAAGGLVPLSCLLALIPHPVSRPAIAVAPHPNT